MNKMGLNIAHTMESKHFELQYNGGKVWSIVFLVIAPVVTSVFILYRMTVRLASQEAIDSVTFKNGQYQVQPGDNLVPLVDAVALNDLMYNFVIPFSLLCILGLVLSWDWRTFFGFKQGLQRKQWLFFAASATVIIIAGLLLPHDPASDSGFMMRMIRNNSLLSLIIIPGIMLPIIEEIVFRRFLFDLFSYEKLYPYIPIAVTTLLFAFLHNQYSGSAIYYILGLGVLLGYARHFSNGLLLPIIIHCVNNILPILMFKL